MEEKIYYVYAYVRLDTNTYFYIGKGKNNRYLKGTTNKDHYGEIEVNGELVKLHWEYC